MKRWLSHLFGAMRREDGVASFEFVLVFPPMVFIFVMAFEGGMLMLRNIMLERSVDVVMHDLKMNSIPNPTFDDLKVRICAESVIIGDCMNVLTLNLQPVSLETWDVPTTPLPCRDRSQPIQPSKSWDPLVPDELMIVRACAVFDPLFPTTGIGLKLPKGPDGKGYALTSTAVFVNEPV
jgi:TadE-like protein